MSKKLSTDDASVFLYMVPFIASAVYALYLGVVNRVSFVLSSSVYLEVTRDPIVFLIGTLSVMLGVALEVSSTGPEERTAKLGSVSNTLQVIAVTSFILAGVCALYAHGFSDVSGAASDFIAGRFSLVFPIMLVLLSFLITARINLGSIGTPSILGIIAMLFVPVSVYEVGKRNTVVGLVAALVLMMAGVGLFLLSNRKASDKKDLSDDQ
jgi:hypothetical protein